MRKDVAKKIVEVLPDSLKNIASYLKNNFDKSGQDTLDNATGTIGILIKLFAQSYVDKYFENMTKDKLANYGSDMYLKASFCQIQKSLEIITDNTQQMIDAKSIVALFDDTFKLTKKSFSTEHILTIFTPQYHPIIQIVKEKFISLLKELNFQDNVIKAFQRHYNENIASTIKESFGEDDYAKHIKDTQKYILNENEAKLLSDIYKLCHIGFKDDEQLSYEETFAEWKPIEKVNASDDSFRYSNEYEKFLQKEKALTLAESLVDSYFESITTDNTLLNILFAIADFGKGKTIFLRQYASKLAKQYVETGEGYFPIYFNLRNYGSYSSSATLGIIADYLATDYGIKIEEDSFKYKKYIFLIDSLDESGELTKPAIEKVIESIKCIQNLDKEKCRYNRIIITSRPFSDGLEYHLRAHKPYQIKNKEGTEIPQYISIYGFKAEQFNHWLLTSLKNYPKFQELTTTGFAEELIKSIQQKKNTIDIHQKLFKDKTLSVEELKRPIFSYMIFQLIINNVDFSHIGKIGIYLSFLNLLTKEAKHINDKHYETNLEDEIIYRNILHAIASLWMYQKEQSQQGVLRKSDICRVLDGKTSNESDREILERYKKEGVTEIQFLSHSYFGEQKDCLHFQHQSFAEILLAEYYLKVFIKYALDKTPDIDEARSKLMLGEPTDQTVSFFKELIRLLKETVSTEITPMVIEKRKLLFPLMASLAHEKHNVLFSDKLYYKWFEPIANNDIKSSRIYPKQILENWAIDEDALEKIIVLAKEILDAKTTILSAKSLPANALFNNELTVFHNKSLSDIPTDIDKWLSLVLGNILETDIVKKQFFNSRLSSPENLFEMIRNWNYSKKWSAPFWAHEYFNGMQMKNTNQIDLQFLNFSNINFSHSHLQKLDISNAFVENVKFNHCEFENITLTSSNLINAKFDNISILGERFQIGFAQIGYGIFIPNTLANCLLNMSRYEENTTRYSSYIHCGSLTIFLNSKIRTFKIINEIFNTLSGLLEFGLKKNYFTIDEIKSWFKYEKKEDKEKFEALIDTLNK
ncbi:NACHT domain-containing protein [Sulfurospirillum multivorans]|uniref:NACHT domain-containing protein n=2 Tax=Sulfurospirillum multivorans TaxID=66821 RepID=A0AA86AKQ2_SULMK|nr:NACHT domain-containing protein [Sulfurospirillum multivorans]AHJ12575.1 hypothetical protein SMUL_1314 [Sulfurospirillum multivorans DSM 12446]QEH06070.1 hypothetical protein SMN_1299 [Sulfurospirillum multivorans]